LPAAAPPSVRPVAVTILPVPTLADANVAPAAAQLTVSPPRTPVSVQVVIVALDVVSYGLFATVTVAVTVIAVMFAVVVAVVLASA
jgi:hypothetical protein